MGALSHEFAANQKKFQMNRERKSSTIDQFAIQAVLELIREKHIPAAHYFGMADKQLIRALKAEPGFILTITDYHDRWGGGRRFWGNDDGEDYPIPPCPEWLEDVPCYQEGLALAPLLIWDLPKTEAEQLTHVTRAFEFIAVAGEATEKFWPMLAYTWKRKAGTWLGTLKHPASSPQQNLHNNEI